MTPSPSDTTLDALADVARGCPGLELFLMFGSRARVDFSPRSDWDFGYLATADVDYAGLLAGLVTITNSDRVDLVDLGQAGGLLRYRAARDGQLVFEITPGLEDRFRFEAVQFWCESVSILERGYDEALAELKR